MSQRILLGTSLPSLGRVGSDFQVQTHSYFKPSFLVLFYFLLRQSAGRLLTFGHFVQSYFHRSLLR